MGSTVLILSKPLIRISSSTISSSFITSGLQDGTVITNLFLLVLTLQPKEIKILLASFGVIEIPITLENFSILKFIILFLFNSKIIYLEKKLDNDDCEFILLLYLINALLNINSFSEIL